jgi:glycosyltransferase involved in cell wall biosynthesis
MRIGIDTRILASEGNIPFRNYTYQLLQYLSQHYVQHQLYAFSIVGNEDLVKDLRNVEIIYINPSATNLFSLKIWYDFKLSLALKKHEINLLICPNGVCSLTTKVPQILIVQHLDFNKKTTAASINSLSFYKKYTASFLKKAKTIAALSTNVRDEIVSRYNVQADKIAVTQFAIPAFFKPINWEEREAIKDQYAEGFEYFIFSAGLHPANNLVSVLKAFSIFKKWQKSGMKLLIIASNDKYLKPELDRLSNYKHRNDVYIQKGLTPVAIADLVAASYALIYTPSNAPSAHIILEALQCDVPVIASNQDVIKDFAGESALYVDPAKPEEIAEAMKTIFKDENLRSKMIAVAKQQNEIFHQNKTSVAIAQLIDAAVSQ